MKFSKIFIALSIVAGIAFSCNRDETNDTATTKEMVQADATAEVLTNSNVDLAMDFLPVFGGTTTSSPRFRTSGGDHNNYPCAAFTITSSDGGFPKTITIDFGTGCTDKKNFVRKGKMSITFTERLFMPGASLIIAYQDFYVNGTKIDGEMKLTNTTVNGVPSFSKEITNGKITYSDGTYFTFTSSRKWRMAEGFLTPLILTDDVWEIYEGSQNITKSDGTYFTSNVKVSLVKKITCHNIVKGSVVLKGSKINGTLDFGNGDCDNIANFTDASGNVIAITLKH